MAQHTLYDLHPLSLRDELATPGVTELMGRIARSTRPVDQTRGLTQSGPLIVQCVIRHAGSSCQEVWTFLPAGCGSGHGIASVEFDTEEFIDGHELAATATFTTDADLSAPQVAGVAPSLTEEAFLAARTFIDGLVP